MAKRRATQGRAPAKLAYFPYIYVGFAVLLGGAGLGYPAIQLVVELMAILLIARRILALTPADQGASFWVMLGIIGAALGLLLIQMVPLPPGVWHALPGHGLAAQIYKDLGWAGNWHAISMAPDKTLGDLLAMMPAVAAFLVAATLPHKGRLMALRIIVLIAVVGALLGALQAGMGAGSAPMPFATSHRGFGVGFFVNRNHQATLLLVSIVLATIPGVLSASSRDRGASRNAQRPLILAVVALLAVGVVATLSRTGLFLLPVALVGAGIALLHDRGSRWWIPAVAIGVVAAGALIYPTQLTQQILARYATTAEDDRYDYWANTLHATGQALPLGTGFGTFTYVYPTVEVLEQVKPQTVNHAHSDYLELLLEGGLPVALIVVAGLIAIMVLFVRRLRAAQTRDDRARIIALGLGILLILAGSVVDYPLRMAAIMVLFGLLVGMLLPSPQRSALAPERVHRTWPWVAGVSLVAVALGGLSLSANVSRLLLNMGYVNAAAGVAPWWARPWSRLADAEQDRRDWAGARAAGMRALAIAPMDPAAIRAVAISDVAMKEAAQGRALLGHAAALGWRDALIQAWIIQDATEHRQFDVAMPRIDALIRQHQFSDVMMEQLRAYVRDPGANQAMAAALAKRPPWRAGLMSELAKDSGSSLPAIELLIRRLRALGQPVDLEETALIRWRLADADAYQDARAVWLLSGGHGLIANPDFNIAPGVLPAGAPPFAWRAPTLPGTTVSVVEMDRANRAALISTDSSGSGAALTQTVALQPGRYRVQFRAKPTSGDTMPVALWLRCVPVAGDSQPSDIPLEWTGAGADWRRATGEVIVPSPCPGQEVTIAVTPTQDSHTFWIDDLTITPLSRP